MKKTELTVTMVIVIQRDSYPKLAHEVLPNGHEKLLQLLQNSPDYEDYEPIPSLSGGREQGDDHLNCEVVFQRVDIFASRCDRRGLFGLSRHEPSEVSQDLACL